MIIRVARARIARDREASFAEASRSAADEHAEIAGLVFLHMGVRLDDAGRTEVVWISGWETVDALLAVVEHPRESFFARRYPEQVESDLGVELYETID